MKIFGTRSLTLNFKFIIPVSIFRFDIYFVIGSIEYAHKTLKKDLQLEQERLNNFIENQNDGATICFTRGLIIVWAKHPETNFKINLLHEVEHACNGILREVGIPHCHETEEVYAYLKTFVHYQVNNELSIERKRKKKIKKKPNLKIEKGDKIDETVAA